MLSKEAILHSKQEYDTQLSGVKAYTEPKIFEAMEEYTSQFQSPEPSKDVEAEAKEQHEALLAAIEVIKQWHNADDVWNIYYNHSPEMKPIRNAINQWAEQVTKATTGAI